ncbi:hypothetical protein NESM_000214100 [Novymonas esmeraldas]|uniref:Uncharacterized protein n=1 Tax=Novymonas esmeraldas TaxID=1808958 RepID=A0AAW0F5G5_9TRYP
MSDHNDSTSPARTRRPDEVHPPTTPHQAESAKVAVAADSTQSRSAATKRSLPTPLSSLGSLKATHQRDLNARRYMCPPLQLPHPLPPTAPSTSSTQKQTGFSTERCEPTSLFSSNQRFGEASSLGISASTSTVPPGLSDSITPLHWLRTAEGRVVLQPKTTAVVVPDTRARAPAHVFERFVEPEVNRSAAEEDAMLHVAAAFDTLCA